MHNELLLTIKLDNIEILISNYQTGTSIFEVGYDGETVFVFKDTIERTTDIIKCNYKLIKEHYTSNLLKNKSNNIDYEELNTICVKILFYYIGMYSLWKETRQKSNYDIKFYEKDFTHPTTNDMIIFFLQKRHPNNWESISASYINLDLISFKKYWENRQAYFNM